MLFFYAVWLPPCDPQIKIGSQSCLSVSRFKINSESPVSHIGDNSRCIIELYEPLPFQRQQ